MVKFTADELRKIMEYKHKIRNMSVIAHVDHDAMREERDNALETVQELRRKHLEERQPPLLFYCPITQEVMKDPHFAADGFTYEAQAIRTWFSTGHDTSPMTNLKLPHRNLVPNHALRKETEYALAIEREKIDKVKLQMATLETEHDDMRLNVEELECRSELGRTSTTKSQAIGRKQRMLFVEKTQELDIVNVLLESYKREADKMREKRNSALRLVEEITTKQTKER